MNFAKQPTVLTHTESTSSLLSDSLFDDADEYCRTMFPLRVFSFAVTVKKRMAACFPGNSALMFVSGDGCELHGCLDQDRDTQELAILQRVVESVDALDPVNRHVETDLSSGRRMRCAC